MAGVCDVDSPDRLRRRCRPIHRPLAVTLFLLAIQVITAFGVTFSYAGVGELGPPPSEIEVEQALSAHFSAGHPPDTHIQVGVVGPVIVGQPALHANPPPDPWCVRCGYPDQGASLMYPVSALVSVTTTQGLNSSALGDVSAAPSTTSYSGTSCPGVDRAQFCPMFYLYRNEHGHWQVA